MALAALVGLAFVSACDQKQGGASRADAVTVAGPAPASPAKPESGSNSAYDQVGPSTVSLCDSVPVQQELRRIVREAVKQAPGREGDTKWWNLANLESKGEIQGGWQCSAVIQMGNSEGVAKRVPFTYTSRFLDGELLVEPKLDE